MSTSLRQRLDDLASTFASGVLQAIRNGSIEDLLTESGGARGGVAARSVAIPSARAAGPRGTPQRSGRLARRSADDIGEVIDRIVALVKGSARGLRAEQIRQTLHLLPKEMPRPLKEAVDAGRLGKSGQKRATTYSVKGSPAPKKAAAVANTAPRAVPKPRRDRKGPKPKASMARSGARARAGVGVGKKARK